MNDVIKNFAIDAVVNILIWLLDSKTPDAEVFTFGERAGKWVTVNAKGKIGNVWENIEAKLQLKLSVFMGGFGSGLNSDDQV